MAGQHKMGHGPLYKTVALMCISKPVQLKDAHQPGNTSWTDYSVEANVKVDNWNGTNRVYVAGRYQDGNNFYAASLYNSNGGKLEIRKKVSGSTTTLATLDYPLTTGTWYTVKLELSVQQFVCT